MHRLLIDTDPGVDDALALLMAHAHPRAEVVALTTTAGNVGLGHTTANALKLLECIGAATPVYPGCAVPLVQAADDAAFVHGRDGFGDTGYVASSRTAESEPAATAMVRLARQHAGALTFVMLGPLTNLALALRLDPDLPQRVPRMVVMGGAVTGRGNTALVPAEFNIAFDPEAAAVVFDAWPRIELVDWEATVAHGIPYERVQGWLDADNPRARLYAAISRKTRTWMQSRGRPRWLAADALAMAATLEPEHVAQWHERPVQIERTGTATRGATVVDWDRRTGRPDHVAIMSAFDPARFEALLRLALGVA
jgi:purine nucleosidase